MGYIVTSEAIRRDRDSDAARRVEVDTVGAQIILGRARAYVVGLGNILAGEPVPGQQRFVQLAGGTAGGVGLLDAMWVERIPGFARSTYEARVGAPITRLTPAGSFEPAPPAASYLAATFTTNGSPELPPGVDVSRWPALATAIRDRSSASAVSASELGSLGGRPGFYLLEAGSFGHGPNSRGYLVVFVPQGWLTASTGGDPRLLAVSLDGRHLEGFDTSPARSASFGTLGRRWRIDVATAPSTGLQTLLPWLAIAWPIAAALIAVLVGRGIARRRRAEREVERIFDLSLDLLCIAGLDGHFKRVNPAFERTLGYTTQQLLSRPFLDFVHPDDRARTVEAMEMLERGEKLVQFENRYMCSDGSARWLQWSALPMPDEGLLYAAARDVTDRRRAADELRETQRMVEASRDELRLLADEQAALRRVATLVAREASQAEVFAAIAEEIGQLLGTEEVRMLRYEDDRSAVVVASRGDKDLLPIGSHLGLDDDSTTSRVFRTERAARIDDYARVSGPITDQARSGAIRCVVATPVVVEGRFWGAITAGASRAEPLPPDTESRMGQFTELMATAIANTESHARAERLGHEQAALRRVATLVAEGAPPTAVLDAVAGEMEALLDADQVVLNRFEPSEEILVLAHRGLDMARTPVGSRVSTQGESVTAMVRRTGRPARTENYEGARGALAELARATGLRASVAAPIVVEGRLWGLVTASWRSESPPPDTEERMAQFAQLLDAAIANADSRDQLTASRERLLTAADEARRRVVRDLHDGAQQRLVHTIVTLKLAQQALGENDGHAESLVGEALENAQQGNADLRELAHGILPAVLTRGGLRAGIDAVVARLDLPVEVDVPADRFPAEIEASAYFIVVEALTNVVKHSRAGRAEVTASVADGMLRVEVRDDGTGGADRDGHGLVGITDRATALGGRLEIESPAGGGTLVAATLPLPAGPLEASAALGFLRPRR